MSKKGSWIKVLAIGSAVVGAVVAVVAYLKNKSKRLSEELDFDNSLYFDEDTSMMDEDGTAYTGEEDEEEETADSPEEAPVQDQEESEKEDK